MFIGINDIDTLLFSLSDKSGTRGSCGIVRPAKRGRRQHESCRADWRAQANPKLLDSMYTVERIIPTAGAGALILVVKRHGASGSRVAVIRV